MSFLPRLSPTLATGSEADYVLPTGIDEPFADPTPSVIAAKKIFQVTKQEDTMRYLSTRATTVAVAIVLAACTTIDSDVTRLVSPTNSALTVTPPWGPETPNFNLEVILRGDPNGFGLVKFRQPNDADRIVNLDVWVRDLQPNSHYRLQRATDTNVNDDCTGTNWLTLGRGLVPQDIVTDARGTGRAELFRNLAAFPVGSRFDIHFRVIDAAGTPVLNSDCYQFTVSQ